MSDEVSENDELGPLGKIFDVFDYFVASHTAANVLIITLVILAAIPIIGINVYSTRGLALPRALQTAGARAADGITAIFTCAAGKTIHVRFENGEVALELSDGRSLTLPRAMSASGARYANADESFVFWNKGDTAFIDEHGERTYEDCITQG